MELKVKRKAFEKDYTIGDLFVDGQFVSNTLEDTYRRLTQDMPLEEIKSKKVYGKTAIPKGTYKIDMETISPKFKDRSWAKPYGGKIPRLVNVPGYEGVLLHPGNDSNSTSGCILPGKNSIKGMVTDSISTFSRIMDDYLVPAHKRGETITITIE